MGKVMNSFRYAIQGVQHAWIHERNFRLHVFVGIFVMLVGLFLEITPGELSLVIFLVFFILILEIINTAMEHFLDIVKPRLHTQVAIVKNLMAAVVFVGGISAAIIGLRIFVPYIIELW